MISERLRNETAEHHQAIENAKGFNRLGAEDFTQAEYIRILEKFYGFYRPFEENIRRFPALVEALQYERRFKLPLLERDLGFFGHTPEQLAALPVCEDLPDMTTEARLLGCIYVMEGSTHGAQFIAKRLRQQLNLTGEGVAFYECYGPDTMPQWKAFKQVLDESKEAGTNGNEVVQAASDTFKALHRWMDR